MAIARPEPFAVAICQALGIDPSKTRTLTLTITAQEAPRVEIVQLVYVEETDKLVEALKFYTLHEVDP
jgi:hypothetical protein